jgi:hypothetical protein
MILYVFNLLLGFNQLINTICLGYPDETISARAYRLHKKTRIWYLTYRLIDMLFFFQPNHCYKAYLSEIDRKQSPPQERQLTQQKE